MKIFVLAKNLAEFEHFVMRMSYGFKRTDFVFVHNTHVLRGIRDLKVIELEGFILRADHREIREEVFHICQRQEAYRG